MDIFVAAVALTVALAACITDLRTRRIPNSLTFTAALAALVFHTITGGTEGLKDAGIGWLTAAAIFIIPFALRGLGGGDVKLLAALGAWLGASDALSLAASTAIAGGVLAIVVAIARGYLRQALRNIRLLLSHWAVTGIRPLNEVSLENAASPRLAYGVPIFLGTVVTLWLR